MIKCWAGITLMSPACLPPWEHSFHETTTVTFGELSADEIAAYVATGEAFGKAGAYGIQGPAGAWVKCVDGCYFNVMGLPLHAFANAVDDAVDAGHIKL